MNGLLPLSIFIITKNEADRIGQTLKSIEGLANEILVVDSGSTDNTCEIAKQFGAKVIVNAPFPGYGPQKRYAEEQCQYDWILNLDADEVVSTDLFKEIVSLFSTPHKMGKLYSVRIIDILPHENSYRWYTYSKRPVRLYNRLYNQYSNSTVHDRVKVTKNEKILKLKAPLLHYSVLSINHFVSKLERYAKMLATDYALKKRQVHPIRLATELPLAFIKCYFGRRYVFRGINGFLMAMIYAHYRLTRLIKIIELQNKLFIQKKR